MGLKTEYTTRPSKSNTHRGLQEIKIHIGKQNAY